MGYTYSFEEHVWSCDVPGEANGKKWARRLKILSEYLELLMTIRILDSEKK